MQEYLKTLVPKLKQFSDALDTESKLVGNAFLFYDVDGEVRKMVFKKNNELSIFHNGFSQAASKWEYIPGIKSLQITYAEGSSILLNHQFINNNVLILKKDSTEDFVLLVNDSALEKDPLLLLKSVENKLVNEPLNDQVSTSGQASNSDYGGSEMLVLITVILFAMILLVVVPQLFN